MDTSCHRLIFDSTSDEPITIMVEPEAWEWTIRRGDVFEVRWPAKAADAPAVRWYGKACVAVFPPTDYELLLNGKDAVAPLLRSTKS